MTSMPRAHCAASAQCRCTSMRCKAPASCRSTSQHVALLSFCAHKLGGPKGVGALYVRRRPRPALQPLQFGGSHEGGLRPGTLATHQLAGFGVACELARMALDTEPVRIRALRERLWLALQAAVPLWRNG